MSRFAYEEKFGDFAAGKYDIMVGTQMVSKGLNFPQVTLVGVLGTDMSLYSDDFRSFERTFSLLTQVVGRSGRFDLPGGPFIETASPIIRSLRWHPPRTMRPSTGRRSSSGR